MLRNKLTEHLFAISGNILEIGGNVWTNSRNSELHIISTEGKNFYHGGPQCSVTLPYIEAVQITD
jgi:hypothetical protein